MDISTQYATHLNNECYITGDSSILFSADFPNAQATDDEIGDFLSTDPQKAVEVLLSLTKKYPDEPILAYHLAKAYEFSDDHDFSKQIEENNYRRFPHFSLIRCDYASKCLEENNIMQAAAALDYTFNLSDLYPKRSVFHLLEEIIFQSTLTKYFCKIKDFDRAVLCIVQLRMIHKEIPVIKDLQNIIIISIIEQNLSTVSLNCLFGFDENKE